MFSMWWRIASPATSHRQVEPGHSGTSVFKGWGAGLLALFVSVSSLSEIACADDLVDHARDDAYWAELAKDYPPFVLPEKASRAAARANPAEIGSWGPVIEWPHIPVTAANLPDGRVLTWASNKRNKFTGSQGKEYTYAATWDPETNTFVERDHTSHDMFCSHTAMLEDGRIIINGGTNRVTTTSLYDYRTDQWSKTEPMSRGRWYPTTVAMPDGTVFTSLGTGGGEYPELWDENEGWKVLTGASFQDPVLNYSGYYERNWWPLLHLDPKGKILHSGPTPKMHSIDTAGLGNIQRVGPEIHAWYPKHGTTVMYDVGKLLVAGGAIAGNNQKSSNKAMLIDINGSEPDVSFINSMTYARKFHNGVVLPTGEVLVVGGNTSGLKFSDQGTILPAEIWNPETKKWRTVDSISVPRNYHSIALLLTDGRVLSGGGGLCACAADHSNAQIYTPPYLYNDQGQLATRPEIRNAPDSVKHGQSLSLQSAPDIQKFTLIKMSSTTHAVNTDLRFLEVPFSSEGNGRYQLDMHGNRNILTPGFWMLFAIDSDGVPSKAKVIQIKTIGTPTIHQPKDQAHVVDSKIQLAIKVENPDNEPLTFEAQNLPSGLQINSSTGEITGIAEKEETKNVIVTVSTAYNRLETRFEWQVYSQGKVAGVSLEYYPIDGTSALGQLPDFSTLHNPGFLHSDSFSIPDSATGNYAIRYLARLTIKNSGTYTFYLTSRDGSSLWINGSLLIDNDGVHDVRERQNAIELNKGEHALEVRYFSSTANGLLDVQFSGPDQPKSPIPESLLIQNPQHNIPPQLLTGIQEQKLSLGAEVDIAIRAVDPNGDPLRFSASNLPEGVQINPLTGHISGTTKSIEEKRSVISVSDISGLSTDLHVEWMVSGSLTIAPIIKKPKSMGKNISYYATTNGGINNQYHWDFGDGNASASFSDKPFIKHAFSRPGRHTITLIVNSEDSSGNEEQLIYQFEQLIYSESDSVQRPNNSMSVIYDKDTTIDRLWNVNPDNDTVSVFDTLMHTKITEIPVGKQPRSLAKAPDGSIWVVNKSSAAISIIDPDTKTVKRTLNLPAGSQPHGIVFSPVAPEAFVTLEATGQLVRIASDTQTIQAYLAVGPNPRHVSINAEGDTLYISRYITPKLPGEHTTTPLTRTATGEHGGEVVLVDANTFSLTNTIILRHSEEQDAEHAARGIPNYLGSIALSPDGLSAWVPSKQDNIKRGLQRDGRPLTHDSTIRSISSRIDLINEEELTHHRIDHDNGGVASAAIFGRYGIFLFVALEGSREIEVIDAYSNEPMARFNTGRAPQGLAISPDGLTLYSHNFTDRTITVFDLHDLIYAKSDHVPLIATYLTVLNEKLSPSVLRGKQLFYDSQDPRLASERYISCAACHNEGASDGRVWDMSNFGEGLRNTISLVGVGGTAQGPLHWSGNFDEVQDFERQIRSMANGTGLIPDSIFHSGTYAKPLGNSKAGLNAELDDLARYVASLDKVPEAPATNRQSRDKGDREKGRVLFVEKGCADCHNGVHFTDSRLNRLHDIGTLKTTSGNRSGEKLTGIDTPTLRGLWLTAPYLHDGSANTLEEAIAAHQRINTSTEERRLLALFLLQIDHQVSQPKQDSNTPPVEPPEDSSSGGGGNFSVILLVLLTSLSLCGHIRRRKYYTLTR